MSCSKINEKWIKDLKMRLETIKFLRKKTGKNLFDIGLGRGFLNMTTETQARKTKTNKWDYIKPKGICTAVETINKKAICGVRGNISQPYI